MTGYFITGTDTGVGKTLVSAALLHRLNQRGLRTAAMKPLASGCHQANTGLRNDDALLLQQTASVELDYEQVNPYAFEPAIAPHLAAREVGVTIDVDRIKRQFDELVKSVDAVIVEGVGGWKVPINENQSMVDVARELDLPVILVVGMRLGCLNHALITVDAIEHAGLPLAGWVANSPGEAMPFLEENIFSLKSTISAPFLGELPYQDDVDIEKISAFISLP